MHNCVYIMYNEALGRSPNKALEDSLIVLSQKVYIATSHGQSSKMPPVKLLHRPSYSRTLTHLFHHHRTITATFFLFYISCYPSTVLPSTSAFAFSPQPSKRSGARSVHAQHLSLLHHHNSCKSAHLYLS